MSTTPVREALLELCRAGSLMPVRNRGFRVRPLTMDDLNNIFAVREVLEGYAMTGLAKQKRLGADALHSQADDVAAAVKRKDVREYVAKDNTFHRAMIAQLDNPTLTNMIMSLRDGMRW